MSSDNPEMTEPSINKPRRSLLDEIRSLSIDADKGREPELVAAQRGRRQVSWAALLERVLEQFIAEHAGGSEALQAADTETKRIKLLLSTVDYVLAVESIQMDDANKAQLMRRTYTELFSYGPLDALLADETVTTITLEGANKVAVRHGHGELQTHKPIFDDELHLRRVLHRMLLESGAVLTEEEPIIEASLSVNERAVSLNVAGPPVTLQISADIRIHPASAPTLEDMIARGVMSEQAADLLRAIAKTDAGVIVVGEPEAGKTTLLSVLAHLLPEAQQAGMIAVERAGVMHLPTGARRLTIEWAVAGADNEGEGAAVSFEAQIQTALDDDSVSCILVDEVRVDGAEAVAPLLASASVPRQMWAFRGPASAKRLISALGMLARRSVEGEAPGEAHLQALYQRLPFVLTLRRRDNKLMLHSVAEWQYENGAEYPGLVELMAMGWEGLEMTGKRPVQVLDLPDDFWNKDEV